MLYKNKLLITLIIIILFNSFAAYNFNATKTNNKYVINLENYDNFDNVGIIGFGSQLQKMKMIFSTGSGLTWVTGKNCENCKNTGKYNNKLSEDFKNTSRLIHYKVK